MCYLDMTFCSARCLNLSCPRHSFHSEGPPGSDWLPRAMADLSYGCPEYEPIPDQADGEVPG